MAPTAETTPLTTKTPLRRVHVRLTGIVQSVGMRPFVYGLATRYGLAGWVLNDGAGVEIEVEGAPEDVQAFLVALRDEPPPLARVTSSTVDDVAPCGERGFAIRRSVEGAVSRTLISPDLTVCPDCLRELHDPADRRYRYPFINCTHCGPRYTIVTDLPYDRDKTTMARFEMCPDCRREYEDPTDRRFHAQPVACPKCGPRLWLADEHGVELPSADPIARAAELLRAGKVLAIKGLGGFHLAVDATSNEAVARLRTRKAREEKPLALMSPDMDAIRRFAEVSSDEERLLTSVERPIVLLHKLDSESGISGLVAPRNQFYGVMLPYTPLHALLLDEGFTALVMTSGNITDEPISYDNADAVARLQGIADAFLLHDRDIHIRTDDSIARVVAGEARVSRRARGYVPMPVFLSREYPAVVALGPELKNTVCLLRGREAFLSHHIGDLKNLAAYNSLKQAVTHLSTVLEITPELAACDLHPGYLSTRYARELPLPLRAVQHHHAHVAACLAENGVAEKVIGVAFDGTGYGPDGAVWGGEFLLADLEGHQRLAHIEYVPLPGGDAAAEEPARMALAYLYKRHGSHVAELDLPLLRRLGPARVATLVQMMERGLNCPPTSSTGRLFNAVAALVGLRDRVSYEGQAAIELEGIADQNETGAYSCPLAQENGVWVARTSELVGAVVDDLASGLAPAAVSARFHNAVVALVLDVCQRLRADTGVSAVALSGGVWQNARLLSHAMERLRGDGFTVYSHRLVPTNDGGVSLGQAVVVGSGGGIALSSPNS